MPFLDIFKRHRKVIETDRKIILQIEKRLNRKLEKDSQGDTFGYTTDQQGNVITLGLYRCQIKYITPIIKLIKDFKKLTDINLGKNQITDISSLKELKELTELSLSYNQLTDISALKELKELKKLTKLSLFANELTGISGLKELKKLTELRLSYNQLTDVSALKELKELTILYLNDNQLTNISGLKELKDLKELYLNDNQLTNISGLQELKKLSILHLSYNPLKKLPKWICDFPKMDIGWIDTSKYHQYNSILFYNNPVEAPPIEIIKQGKEAMLNYFEQLENENQVDINDGNSVDNNYLYEAKLILIGEERSGKSTIAKALSDDNFKINPNEKSTEGIEILKWNISKTILKTDKDFLFNIWDFGGQEIYHSTHQFFLTKRSLYLFISETRKDLRFDDFYYWLNIVNSLTGNSPIIVIQNKSDQASNETNISEYRNLFPQIITDLQKISCNTEHKDWENYYQHSLDMLKDVIYKVIKTSQIEGIGDKLPNAWVMIKKEISKLQQKSINYISLQNYYNICKQHGLDIKKAEFLSDYFHDLGIFLHFKHDIQLRNTIFLNHKYVTKGIYKVFDNKKIMENYGKFTDKDLIEIWNEPEFIEKQAELLNLIKNREFKICFQHKGYYLAPQLFNDEKPEIEWRTYDDNLIFYYSYQFLPKGFLSQIIVMLNQYIYQDNYWKYGVLLEYKKSRALISEKRFKNENKISIRVEGELKRDLLVLIGSEIEEINKSFTNLNVNEILGCNCTDCSKSENPYSWKLETINRAIKKGKKTVECQKSFVEVEINSLLGNYIPNEQLIKYQVKNKNIINIYGNQNTVLQDINANNINIDK